MIRQIIRANRSLVFFAVLVCVVAVFFLWLPPRFRTEFSGAEAFGLVEKQLGFGARVPGSSAHSAFLSWAGEYLRSQGWLVYQDDVFRGQSIKNLIAEKGSGNRWILLGAHFDSRMIADQDPGYPGIQQAVDGANDGASGVAVLMELARVLQIPDDTRVTLVLFDAEDQGRLSGWEWIMGSTYYAETLYQYPEAVVIVDMVGDKDLNLMRERNSDEGLQSKIWQIAATLGYGKVFLDEPGYSMLDDHTPFLKLGIPAVDIIDFDYPFWHTTQDNLNNVSAESLEAVGKTLETWVETYPGE